MTTNRLVLTAALATAICRPMPGLASDSDAALADVVVSASKIEQTIREAPTNVSVISAKQLERGDNFVLGDALTAKVPSLYLRGAAVDGARAGSTMQISFRGMGINRNLLLVDGQSMTDAYSGQINWSAVSLNDIERIEVIPGVGSALYGSSALGGVISVITKAPTQREMTAQVTKGFSDGARTKIEAGYRDKFENGLGVVINYSLDDRDGYAAELVTASPSGTPVAGAKVVAGMQATTTPAGASSYVIGDKGFNASKAENANVKLYFDLSPSTKLHAGVSRVEDTFIARPYHLYLADFATGQPLALPTANTTATDLNIDGRRASLRESAFFGTNPGGRSVTRYFVGMDTKVFGDAQLKLKVGKVDQDGWSVSAGSATANTMTSGTGTMLSSPNNRVDGLAELSFGLGQNHFVVAGLAYERAELNNKKYTLANWTNIGSKTGINSSADGISTTMSLFAQDQISVGDKLMLYLGGRYDTWRSHGAGTDFVTPANSFVSPERTDSSFNPKLAAVYMVSQQVAVKGSLGTGFRAPNNYELYANPTFSGAAAPNGKLILGNPALKPETSLSWDLSVDMRLKQGGDLKVAYYQTRLRDMIYQKVTKVPTYILPGTTNQIDYWGQQDNVASAKIRGIELAGAMPVTSWLKVTASYTYTGAVVTDDGGLNTGMVGKRLSNVPKNMVSLGLEAQRGDWSGEVSSRYTGEIYGSSDNLNSDSIKDVWMGYSKYWITDLKVNYRVNKNFKASLAINNLFDKTYFAYYPMPRRNAAVTMSASF